MLMPAFQQVDEIAHAQARLPPCQYQDVSRHVHSLDIPHKPILWVNSGHLHDSLLAYCREPIKTVACSPGIACFRHPVA